jgi:flagellar motor switch protein FliN/FliY
MTPAPATETAPQADLAPPVEAQNLELPPAVDSGARVPGRKLDILMETAVDITASLGEARLLARDFLRLGTGAIVTLSRQVGEPVDLILNGVRFATGDLVVVGDQVGVRIREILSPASQEPSEPQT